MQFHQCSNTQTQIVAKVITIISTREGGRNQVNQGVHVFLAEQRDKKMDGKTKK